MKLAYVDRWMLRNQLLILEMLDEENADQHAIRRKALEHGYEFAYEGQMGVVCPDKEVLTEDQCIEVIQIMSMIQALSRSDLTGLSKDDLWTAEFKGFDGNEEGGRLGYCQFLVDDEKKFGDLPRGNDFNSHGPLLGSYQRMLEVWMSMRRPAKMDADQVKKVLAASVHPEHRGKEKAN